jgi:hypothetical protein
LCGGIVLVASDKSSQRERKREDQQKNSDEYVKSVGAIVIFVRHLDVLSFDRGGEGGFDGVRYKMRKNREKSVSILLLISDKKHFFLLGIFYTFLDTFVNNKTREIRNKMTSGILR